MIIFQYKNENYVIDDNFDIHGGKYSEALRKDIDLFLEDVTPSSGNAVEQYAERLEKVFGADVHEWANIKYPPFAVDVSDYDFE